ncbi:MAG: hypothetical protein L6Q83_02475 [Gammaproteobacteria bacterium]|nr:hypothetical protein [Gammaproteobacteria bacterium]
MSRDRPSSGCVAVATGMGGSRCVSGADNAVAGCRREPVALVSILLLMISAGAVAQTAPVAPSTMAELPVTELTYPRYTRTNAGLLVVYAPQIEAWPDYRRVIGRSAIEVTLAGQEKVVPGSFGFEGDTKTDLAERVVGFFNLQVTGVSFPGADEATATRLGDFVRATVSRAPKKVPLDLVMSYVADGLVPEGDQGLSFLPPRIFYSRKPAVLVILDGPPVKVPLKGIGLSYAANTNWDLFWVGAESRWFLLNRDQWLVSKNQDLRGKWKVTDELPANFRQLPMEDNWKDVRARVPPPKTKQKTPVVFVSETPAELILTDGRPDFERIEGLDLRYATDTTSDLFQLDENYYYLVSGRWFSTQDLEDGPWLPVTTLPAVFAGIPKNHAKARVRVAVPGTEEAQLAMLEASVPRKATIKAAAAPQIKVTYNGAPEFEPIPGTTLTRAVNTPYDVLGYGAAFYLCYNATWYVGMAPEGPWRVAPKVPDEIYKIPPSSPAYHVTHVKIYGSDGQTVTTGYTGGYTGTYSTSTTIVYGTGWYYPPYVWYDDYYYPYYYYYPTSYGRGAGYNPATGNYGAAEAVYGPYGGAGRAAVYNPETGAYARGRAVWDSNEMAGQAIGYNPRTGTGVATNRYRTEDSFWGETLVRRGDDWVYTESDWANGSGTTDFATSRGTTGTTSREVSDGKMTGSGEISRGGQTATTEMVRTEQGVARQMTTESGETITTARKAGSDDLYAAKDGEVYKRTDDGWQKYGEGGWENVKPSGERASARQGQSVSGDAADRSRLPSLDEASRQAARDAARTMPPQAGTGARDPGGWSSAPARDGPATRSTDRTRELDRDYNARRQGYDRMSQRRSMGQRGGFRGGGRRR